MATPLFTRAGVNGGKRRISSLVPEADALSPLSPDQAWRARPGIFCRPPRRQGTSSAQSL